MKKVEITLTTGEKKTLTADEFQKMSMEELMEFTNKKAIFDVRFFE